MKVINKDFFEAVKNIDDKSIPIILTSPPFKDEDVPIPYYQWYDRFMYEVNRICSDYALILNSATRINDIIRNYPIGQGPLKYGPEAKGPFRIMVWTKQVVQYTYRWQPLFIYKFTDEWNINANIWTDDLSFQPIKSDKNHPYEDPIKLYRTIIKMLPEDKFILDPFAGYGPTPEVCKLLNRKCVSYERDKDRCDKANKRLNGQSPLFVS